MITCISTGGCVCLASLFIYTGSDHASTLTSRWQGARCHPVTQRWGPVTLTPIPDTKHTCSSASLPCGTQLTYGGLT